VSDPVLVSDDDAVRVIRINRPEKKNALTLAMYGAMTAVLEAAATNDAVRCVIIAGVPGAFCAGNDIADFAAAGDEGLDPRALGFLHALARSQKPIVAAVTGIAIGIGTTMLLHCDYVVASADATFATPFTKLGLVPEAASSLLAPSRMGHARAFALLVMGQSLTAQAAREAGIVNAVVEPAEVEDAARTAAREIAALPPAAVAIARRLMRGDIDEVATRIDTEAMHFRERLRSDEARAAFARFFTRNR